MFKHLNAIKIILYIYIIFCFKQCINQEQEPEPVYEKCNYTTDLDEYLNDEKDENKRRCFALSFNFGNNICCYNETNNTCYNMTDGDGSDDYCPKKASIPNNCGLAGLIEPTNSSVCTEITLVQGYCCYVTIKDGDKTLNSCLRTKKLAKVKNEASEQIKNYIEKLKDKDHNYEIEKVDCWNFNIQYFWLSNLIINIILLLL